MRLSDFDSMRFMGERELTSLGIAEHPIVKTYEDAGSGDTYQVCEKHRKYRKAPFPSDVHDVVPFGSWEDILG